jgi:PAS domain S-box-containing protein
MAKEPGGKIFSKTDLKLIIPCFAISFIALLLIGGLIILGYPAENKSLFYLASGGIFFIFLLFIGSIFFLVYDQLFKPLKIFQRRISELKKGAPGDKIKLISENESSYWTEIFKQVNIHLEEAYARMEETIQKKIKDTDKIIADLQKKNSKAEEKEAAAIKSFAEVQKMEKELEEEKNRVNSIVSCLGEGLIVTDAAGKITSFNPAAEWMLEMSESKAIGQDINLALPLYVGKECEKTIPYEDYPTIKAIHNKKILISHLSDNYYFLSKSGKKTAFILSSSPMMQGEEIFGSVTILRNVTREKQLDDAKNNFISIASHQLRTPLTSMRWFSEMLIAGDAGAINKDQAKFLERIYQGTERMIELVNHLLQIARVEAGRVKVEPIPINFKNTVQGVEITLKKMLAEKSQKIKLVFNPGRFPTINMDQEVIWQVFQNLISNASRYGLRKSTITVTGIIEKNSSWAEFSVADKGIEIPKEAQSRIFNKFFRAENAIKLVPEGSGLGLSLVKSLVEGWGGRIWFKSQNGVTTFYFTIPLTGMEAKQGDVGLAI